jgi:hypothetical protein
MTWLTKISNGTKKRAIPKFLRMRGKLERLHFSFVLFSLVQYLLPNLFNLGNPGKTFAARSYREWTYRGDFYNNTGKSSVKISGSIDDEDANVTLSDPDFNWGAVTNPTGAPLGGTGESIVWTGDTGNPATSNKAIIWGGFNGSNTNTGRIYNPTNNTWSPTSTGTNVATARNGHAAVWTGSTGNPATTNKMLISQAASDSRLYDPASNSWSTLPSLPSGILGRQNSSYAWTGNTGNSATANRFIFWGGANRSDGAVYNALDNTWATMATSPLVGRNSQLSACTGSKFIIFGGMSGGGVPLTDGAVYDLETNTWGPIFTTNLAQGPGLSVWTGDRMIFYTGSSGRLLSLNPTNLSVELLAPPPMSMGSNSVFAFKDGKIVYWGGAISGTYYNNGYLYDVTNNTWSTITQTNLGIEARGGAVYVWAGNMLIIFGGNGGTNLNNGQLLGSTYPLSGNVSNFRIDSGTLKKA